MVAHYDAERQAFKMGDAWYHVRPGVTQGEGRDEYFGVIRDPGGAVANFDFFNDSRGWVLTPTSAAWSHGMSEDMVRELHHAWLHAGKPTIADR